MKSKRKGLIGALLVSGSLGISACSMSDNNAEKDQTISEREATEIALKELNGGIVMNSHLDETEGADKYEVNILKENKNYEVDVDSITGKILEKNESALDKSNLGNDKDQLERVSPKISSQKAREIALDRVTGTITELNFDYYNNRLVYDIEISSTYHREVKMKVDAINGEVLQVEEM
ncbi:MAG: PepSY domain-containing protein [Bacillus sp. (in: firmicutes)]